MKHWSIFKPGCALLAVGVAAQVQAAEPIANTPPEALEWAVTQEGVAFAPLIGDRFAEPYMAMVRLPAGLVSPAHVKTADMFGVIVAGTMTHLALDADPSTEVALPTGSFFRIPAGVSHVSKCVSAEDCVSFLYQDGKFDFLPVAR